MAQTTTISTKELKRQAALVYEGKTLKVMLCSVGATGFDAESTVTQWQSCEKSGNGYSRFTAVLGTSSYDATVGAQLLPSVDAVFTATSAYDYDTVVLYINGETNIHSIIRESPNIALASGQTQTYRLTLRCDD